MQQADIKRGAVIAGEGIYRYRLTRRWPTLIRPEKLACFIGLNPSRADHRKDDATVRRCMRFAERWGMAGIIIVNLFALRSRNPKALADHGYPIGPENDEYIVKAASEAEIIIAAWGNGVEIEKPHWEHVIPRCEMVQSLLTGRTIYSLGTTVKGEPRHPLYIPRDKTPERWQGCPHFKRGLGKAG